MRQLTINLTDEQHAKLVELAKQRTKECSRGPTKKVFSVADCLLEFVDTCKPGGSGWKVPGA